MHEAVSVSSPDSNPELRAWRRQLLTYLRTQAPPRFEAGLAILSALLLILSFPDANLWPLAWVGLVPLMIAIARAPHLRARAFMLGWITGTLFFYGSCYWLTYSMVRYGHIPIVISYLLLVPGGFVMGLFPASFSALLAHLMARYGARAIFVAPFLWVALEWGRLGITGQLWNAIGYSQAYVPTLIQAARWGGVYAVGFLIVTVSASIAYLILRRTASAVLLTSAVLAFVAVVIAWQASARFPNDEANREIDAMVVAIQPNVPMEPVESVQETEALLARHIALSESALRELKNSDKPIVLIWPESPMNFMYARDSQFREFLKSFTLQNRASVIFNALEPASPSGSYNSAVMVDDEGRLIAQYDKIRLLPFGEYVPLPRWLPGASLVPVMVGEFTPGAEYPLMPLGNARAGIFICFESAFPSIAREYTNLGADALINVSNDGYLGPTPVMRQHLANAIFRAVENNRPVLRVTNTGITALITPAGEVKDATEGYQTAVRTWPVRRTASGKTFYTRYGELFVGACAALSLLMLVMASLKFQIGTRETPGFGD